MVRRRIGLLAHNSHLYDDLTVTQNVRFAVRASGADVGRIGPACDRLGLTGRLLRTPASKLSAGQRRRVALAVLVARWPELWLLDEPHAGLDAAARVTLNELITEATSGGTTVIIASHEPEFSQSLASRAVTIVGGRVTAERRIGTTPGSETAPPEPDGTGAAAGAASAPAALRVAGRCGDEGTGGPCGVTRSWWPARTSASKPAPGWPCPRWPRSGSWPWSCSPSPSVPTAPSWPRAPPVSSGWPCSSAPCWPSNAAWPSSRGTGPGTDSACRGSIRPVSSWARRRRWPPSWWCSRWCSASGWCVLYGARIEVPWLIVVSGLLGTVGLAATGTLYGALSAGLRVRETLLPFLWLPIAAPVLLAGTRIWQAALTGGTASDATPWLRLLIVFDAVYLAVGVVVYGPIQETA